MSDIISPVKRWYVVGLGAAINLIVYAAATSCLPVLFSEIAEELGLSIVQIGTVWGFSSLAGIFSIITAGFLADRFGASKVGLRVRLQRVATGRRQTSPPLRLSAGKRRSGHRTI